MDKVLSLNLFKMTMEYDATQIADIYNGISESDYEKAIVVKNMINPGGDEVAIFHQELQTNWMLCWLLLQHVMNMEKMRVHGIRWSRRCMIRARF